MKLTAILVAPLLVATSAFGVQQPASSVSVHKPAFRKAEKSALFRDPTVTRGGAVPGWAAYNEQLDKNPLTAKACTSLVGWALGDLLAQIFIAGGPFDMKRFISLSAFGFLYHGPSGHYFYNWP